MQYPLFNLFQPFDRSSLPGKVVEEGSHESVNHAVNIRLQINAGVCILTEWRGTLHRIVYQTPILDGMDRLTRNQTLFQHYGEGQEWSEVLDNGFGKRYVRADEQCFALWSYTMDYNTFGMVEFERAPSGK